MNVVGLAQIAAAHISSSGNAAEKATEAAIPRKE
jgi:hypothetical protein